MREHIWEGIYDKFEDAPSCGDGFYGEVWRENSLEKITTLLNSARTLTSVPAVVVSNTSLLPFLVSVVCDKNGRAVILDFGGGLGFSYVLVSSSLVDKDAVDYHIVDNENTCKMGEQVFAGDSRVHFHSSLPDKVAKFDIVHLGSSLQYVKEWRALLGKLASYGADYFLFTDLLAGDIPTYASTQNYYGSKIPCWFFNVDEVIATMAAVGFKLLFKSVYSTNYLGKSQECPQDNFPKEFRLGRSCCLLFGKND